MQRRGASAPPVKMAPAPPPDYIGECIRNRSIQGSKRVSEPLSFICKLNPNGPGTLATRSYGKASYTVSKSGGALFIDLTLVFMYRGDPARKNEVWFTLDHARKCTQDFYKRFGLNVRIKTIRDGGFLDRLNSDLVITVYDKLSPRSTETEWAVIEDDGGIKDYNSACSLMAHEVGHALGLGDRRKERSNDPKYDCPDRPEGPPNDIMKFGSTIRNEQAQLYPSQIRTIIAPLCFPKPK